MTYDVSKRELFLELRAQGKSLRAIEREIGVGRDTLAKWESECKDELEKLEAIEREALRERLRLTGQARAESLAALRDRVIEELKRRDLTTVPTPKLVDIVLKTDDVLKDVIPALRVRTEAARAARSDFEQLVDSFGSVSGPAGATCEATSGGNGQLKLENVTKLQLLALRRFDAGDIDEHTARTEMALLNALFRQAHDVQLESRLERIEHLLVRGGV